MARSTDIQPEAARPDGGPPNPPSAEPGTSSLVGGALYTVLRRFLPREPPETLIDQA